MKTNMKRSSILFSIVFFIFLQPLDTFAQQRFPKPEFESGHTQPPTITPQPRAEYLQYLDIFVLLAALSIISWLILKKRSRKGVFWMSLFSIAYFGFFREGCVCPVGSVQNITLALFNPAYSIPVSVIIFFITPLIYTLFFGRTFCAGICPLGAIQDIFVWRPLQMQTWLQKLLGLFPYIYLGLAILYAATSTDFIICRYDPFVGIFRLNAEFSMFAMGGILLFTSIFIARPYCRFFCPYGVLLNLFSRLSKKHVTITPSKCIQCRLCENSCPFGAIDKPVAVKIKENRKPTVNRFIVLSLIIPLLIIIGGWTGARFHQNLAIVNPKVHLANELLTTDINIPEEEASEEIIAFRSLGKPKQELYAEASSILDEFYYGGCILGAFIGLVFGLTLASLSIFHYRTDYIPNKGNCLSCARCIDFCPVPAEEND